MVMTQTMKPKLSLSGLTLALAVGGWLVTPARSDPPQPDVVKAPEAADVVAPAAQQKSERANPLETLRVIAAAPRLAASWAAALSAYSSTPSVVGSAGPSEGPPPELEDRLRRLEHQNAELNERLEQIARTLDRLAQSDRRPLPPILSGRPPLVDAPLPAPDGRFLTQTYELPPQRLEPLTALMILPDVPIQVRPLPGGIEVRATVQQHQVFRAFLQMIRPDNGIAPAAPAFGGVRPLPAQAQLKHALRQMQEVEARMRAEQERAERAAGRLGTVGPQEIDEVERRLEELTREVERLRAESERVATEQDRLDGQASDLTDRAEELQEQADDADSRDEANELRSQSRALERQARQIQRQADSMGRQAEKLERRADRLEEESERLQEDLDRGR